MGEAAVVTGASSGLGAELAGVLAAAGFDLLLVARREERLRALAVALERAHGVAAHVAPVDLARPNAAGEIVAACERHGLAVTCLVCDAGFGTFGRFMSLDLERELAELQVNAAAPLALAHAFVPGMVARGGGRVLLVSSVAGFQPGPFMATYHATKAFLTCFGEALAEELRGSGVTVTVSCPGPLATEFDAVAGKRPGRLRRAVRGRSTARVARDAYEAMMAGRVVAVHGAANLAGVEALRLVPRSLVRAAVALVNRRGR